MRERGGRTLTAVFASEAESTAFIKTRVGGATTVHADKAADWNALHARFATKRIGHQGTYSLEGACTNEAESFFSRIRRAEIGHHHHISWCLPRPLRAGSRLSRGSPSHQQWRTAPHRRRTGHHERPLGGLLRRLAAQPRATWQRCRVHFLRSLLATCPTANRPSSPRPYAKSSCSPPQERRRGLAPCRRSAAGALSQGGSAARRRQA